MFEAYFNAVFYYYDDNALCFIYPIIVITLKYITLTHLKRILNMVLQQISSQC